MKIIQPIMKQVISSETSVVAVARAAMMLFWVDSSKFRSWRCDHGNEERATDSASHRNTTRRAKCPRRATKRGTSKPLWIAITPLSKISGIQQIAIYAHVDLKAVFNG